MNYEILRMALSSFFFFSFKFGDPCLNLDTYIFKTANDNDLKFLTHSKGIIESLDKVLNKICEKDFAGILI